MNHPIISIGNDSGYLFKGLIRDTFAFVPEECVTFNKRGEPSIDNVAYVTSGWDVRNMRFNQSETSGSRLFPEVRDDLADLSDDRVHHFVERLKHAYEDVRV